MDTWAGVYWQVKGYTVHSLEFLWQVHYIGTIVGSPVTGNEVNLRPLCPWRTGWKSSHVVVSADQWTWLLGYSSSVAGEVTMCVSSIHGGSAIFTELEDSLNLTSSRAGSVTRGERTLETPPVGRRRAPWHSQASCVHHWTVLAGRQQD